MKRKKIVIAILLIITLIVALTGRTQAAGSFSATLTPSKGSSDRVPYGGTFDVVLKISKITVDDGIMGITAKLTFNQDVVELVDNKVNGLNDWTATYNPDKKLLEIDTASTVKTDTEIAKMTFKVKENTSATIAQIELSNIEGGNSDSSMSEPVKISAVKTMVQIGNGGSEDPTEQPTEQPTTSTSPTITTSPTTTSSSRPGTTDAPKTEPGNTPTTRSGEDIPNSGSEDYIIPLIIAIAALGLISFVNYKKID